MEKHDCMEKIFFTYIKQDNFKFFTFFLKALALTFKLYSIGKNIYFDILNKQRLIKFKKNDF